MKSTKRLVLLALMVAQALILSIIESWIPVPVGIPGVKLGLANIITLVVIVFFGLGDALLVVGLRCALSSIFGGGPVLFIFSGTGGVFSALVMALLYKKMSKTFSLTGISIAGAVAHNLGQLTAAGFVMRDWSVLSYLPILLVSGIIMGCFVGLCSTFLTDALKKTGIMA